MILNVQHQKLSMHLVENMIKVKLEVLVGKEIVVGNLFCGYYNLIQLKMNGVCHLGKDVDGYL